MKSLILALILCGSAHAQTWQSSGYSKAAADSRFVNVVGDTMTGPLTLNGSSLTVTGISQSGSVYVTTRTPDGDIDSFATLGTGSFFSVINPNMRHSMTLAGYGATPSGISLNFAKTRSASDAADANTTVGVNDVIMRINARAADGAAYRQAGEIQMAVDGTPGSSDMPGRIVFLTTPDGSATAVERMRIDNAGAVTVAGNSFSVGGSTLVVSGGKVGVGDATPDANLEVLSGAANTPLSYLLAVSSQNDTTANILSVLANGNVGIGVPVPRAISGPTLDVRGAANSSIILGRTANVGVGSTFGTLGFSAPNQSGTDTLWAIMSVAVSTPQAGLEASSLIFSNRVGGAIPEVMRISELGNVGIGNTAPEHKLQISSGTLKIDGTLTNNVAIILTANGGAYGIKPTSSDLEILTPTAGAYANLKAALITGNSGVVSNNLIQYYSRSKAQITAITPTAVGQAYFCNDCSPLKLVVSTGTAAGNFASVDGGTFTSRPN